MNFEKEVSIIIEALSDDVHRALDQTGKELAKWGVNELKDKSPKKQASMQRDGIIQKKARPTSSKTKSTI